MMKLKKTKTGRTLIIAALSAVVLATGWQSQPKVEAAGNAVPSYEVKFLLSNDTVLKQDFTLKNEVKDAFQITEPAARMLVEYFDTTDLSLNDSGWNVRFRKKKIRRSTN
ncbi:hypothetical protein RE628_12905 [Paenibacillus sp. D2_2]|nr:hypothetical protein [Paenibacillus sp. D2_2]WMT43082.1 hypothetical protein RE628_12905 [Paenibacillus sp. D2_2]